MNNLQLQRVSSLTEKDVAECDFSFKIRAEVAKPITQLALDHNFTVSPLPERTKIFDFDLNDFSSTDDKQTVIFVLKKNKKIYGFAAASKGWNNMVHLDYIGLDVSIRGAGNAQKLLNAVINWTREIGLDALRIECQSNNVLACRFYKKAGMTFGGYDESLYWAIPDSKDEIAVFFYYMLNNVESK